jgi:hypothetical protein
MAKLTHYRPIITRPDGFRRLRLPHFQTMDTWRLSKLSAVRAGRHLCPKRFPRYSFSVRGWIDSRAIVQPEWVCQWKTPATPSRIEHAIFLLVAQWLNKCSTACSMVVKYICKLTWFYFQWRCYIARLLGCWKAFSHRHQYDTKEAGCEQRQQTRCHLIIHCFASCS